MDEILDKHKQDFSEIRRLCLQCHGLDLTSTKLFASSSGSGVSLETKSVLHSMLSGSLLNLAVSIRVNLYQDNFENELIPLSSLAASILTEDNLEYKEITIKDVCDKIIHADSVTKPIISNEHLDKDHHVCIQFKGKHHKRFWTMDICLDLFAEHVLSMLDKLENEREMNNA
nr:hypothetical protein [uncultured Desulfobacter sp.]